MLDKDKHHNSTQSFLVEVLEKAKYACCLPDFMVDPEQDLQLWIQPNHQVMSLDAIEPNDMLIIGRASDL